jgi:hypothetical protein
MPSPAASLPAARQEAIWMRRVDLQTAARIGGEPAETHRALGMIPRAQSGGRSTCEFRAYLKLAPGAPDAAFIKAYILELGS